MRLGFEFYPRPCVGDPGQCPRCQAGLDIEGDIERCPWSENVGKGTPIRLLNLARKGHFPVSGGTLNQSSTFMEAVEIFSAECGEMEELIREEELEDAKRKASQ